MVCKSYFPAAALLVLVICSLPLQANAATVEGCHVFYNNSVFDGYFAYADARDDNAIATDKTPLLPGETATFANYTSFMHGINGIMVDIRGTTSTPNLNDFEFRVGNDNDPDGWESAPEPSMLIRTGAGINGSARITFIWANGAITNKWLQITVKATSRTGLFHDKVFYYGNAIGESGNDPTNARVDTNDEIAARHDPHKSAMNPATITNRCDFNRDGKADTLDEIIARIYATNFLTDLKLITTPPVEETEEETFTPADAPRRVVVPGNPTFFTPWGYDKPENSNRLYPIVINGRWYEDWAFPDNVRRQYPAFFLEHDNRGEAAGASLSDILDVAIAQGERIDLNRVYLIGFSVAGSGSYQLVRGFLSKGKLFAAINRVAGASETVLPDAAVAATSIWLHIGSNDSSQRLQVTLDAYNFLKNHHLNQSAIETTVTDDDVIGFPRVTKILTKNGIEIVRYSYIIGMGHVAEPVYQDPEVFRWMFTQSLEKRQEQP